MQAADRNNPWLADVRNASRQWPGWAAAVAAATFSATVLLAFKTWGGALLDTLAAAFHHLSGGWGDILAFGMLQSAIFGCFLLAAVAAMAREGRSPWRRGSGRMAAAGIGLIIGAGGFCASLAIAAAAGAIVPQGLAAGTAIQTPLAAILFGLGLVAFQSIAEETFFRGWLQPLLCVAWGPWPGLLATSALFGGLHVIAGAHGPVAVINLMLGGVLFGLLALRSGNLFAAAAAHLAWNWSESGVFGLSQDPTGSLMHFGFTGSPLWNGGQDTMNGSLAVVITLAALIAGVALVRKRTDQAS